jgi:hypothetical protein
MTSKHFSTKGQLISEGNLGVSKSEPLFVKISALASKIDKINNIKALYYIR